MTVAASGRRATLGRCRHRAQQRVYPFISLHMQNNPVEHARGRAVQQRVLDHLFSIHTPECSAKMNATEKGLGTFIPKIYPATILLFTG